MLDERIDIECHEHTRLRAATPLISTAIDGHLGRIRQWLLRMLIEAGVLFEDHFSLPDGGHESEALLPKADDTEARIQAIRAAHAALPVDPAPVHGTLARNIDHLAEKLELSTVERELLGFLVAYRTIRLFEQVSDMAHRKVDLAGLAWRLSDILRFTPDEVEAALGPDSVLVSAGLLTLNRHFRGRAASIDNLLELPGSVLNLLTSKDLRIGHLLATAARPAEPGALQASDYDHMSGQRELAKEFLEALRRTRRAGSMLLDGPPGVGKTEFARLLASEADLDAYEIKELDRDGDGASVGERLQYLRLAQNLLRHDRDALLIFDEADEVLSTNGPVRSRGFMHSKAGMIRTLETLQVPTIWITNHGGEVDPAVVRRFDLMLRFRPMPAKIRTRMLEERLPVPIEDDGLLRSLRANDAATPARIEQADRIAQLIAGDDDTRKRWIFRQVLEENLDLGSTETKTKSKDFDLPYRPESLNANLDLDRLIDGLARDPRARICLHGPPGTGKTRFVQHLAERCGVELAEYRASDLLGRYVGESEGNIRKMFEDCSRNGSLLLLDEADSLLRSRQHAQHNFEVNQVNELLKGLERFEGLFVANTNLMGSFDSAVLRRLDVKIRFDWLRPEQRWRLFLDLARTAFVTPRGAAAKRLRHRLDRIECVTPGDFAVLARQLRFKERVQRADDLIDWLEKEVTLKPEARHHGGGIGFTAAVRQAR